MIETGLLEVAQQAYGRIREGFYGLTSTILTLFLMALLRIKRSEGLKRQAPEILGRLLGLDRSPEVKTLRRKLPRRVFQRCVIDEDGRQFEYWLADRSIRLKGYGKVRCVARLDNQTKHQTHVVTTRVDLSRGEVARRMFRRWRQENFLKYMMENYALDGLVSYDMEPADPERETSNPAKKKLNGKIRILRKKPSEAHRRLGLLASNRSRRGKTTAGDRQAKRQSFREEIRKLQQRIDDLAKRRRKLATRIKVRDLPADSRLRLETQRKILTDTVKLVAYRVESALLTAIRPHYSHAEQEGRQLVQEMLQASGDLDVQDNTVTVILEPLSSPHRTRVLKSFASLSARSIAAIPVRPSD